MRNIGRDGCGTHQTFSADVDIIPRDGMDDMLQKFYDDQKIQGKLCKKYVQMYANFCVQCNLNLCFEFFSKDVPM